MAQESLPQGLGEGERISAPLAQRIRRGIEHHAIHGERIEWVQEDRCKVPSRSRKGRFHLVVFGSEGERCGCPDFMKHGEDLGACLHTVSALIDWAKHVDHRVERRHDSRLERDVWDVVETRAGVDRVVGTFAWVGSAYHACWALRGWQTTKDAA